MRLCNAKNDKNHWG